MEYCGSGGGYERESYSRRAPSGSRGVGRYLFCEYSAGRVEHARPKRALELRVKGLASEMDFSPPDRGVLIQGTQRVGESRPLLFPARTKMSRDLTQSRGRRYVKR